MSWRMVEDYIFKYTDSTTVERTPDSRHSYRRTDQRQVDSDLYNLIRHYKWRILLLNLKKVKSSTHSDTTS